MTLDRAAISAGVMAEYASFASFIRSLTDEEWQTPTRCDGWTVADVAAHVSGQLDDVANFRLDGLGSPEAVARQVSEREGRSQTELADEVEAAVEISGATVAGFDDETWNSPVPGGFQGTFGEGVLGLWYDTWIHVDDIRAAIGRDPERGQGLEAAVQRTVALIERDDRGSFTLALEGLDEIEVGGGGRRVEGDPYDFVMIGTGRADPSELGLDPSVNVYADY